MKLILAATGGLYNTLRVNQGDHVETVKIRYMSMQSSAEFRPSVNPTWMDPWMQRQPTMKYDTVVFKGLTQADDSVFDYLAVATRSTSLDKTYPVNLSLDCSSHVFHWNNAWMPQGKKYDMYLFMFESFTQLDL